MSIVLPIVFFAVCLGLFVQRLKPIHWGVLAVWVALVIGYNYVKGSPLLNGGPSSLPKSTAPAQSGSAPPSGL